MTAQPDYNRPRQDVLASDIQALGPDIIEAAEHSKTMTPDEIEDVIDHILLEVSLSPER